MRWLLLSVLLVVLAFMVVAQPVLACPACKDAVAASSDSGDPDDEAVGDSPGAYNHSIYLMIGVPYLSLTLVFFLIYRGLKKNAEYLLEPVAITSQDVAPYTGAECP